MPDRTFFWIAWIGPTNARRIRLHRLDLLRNLIGIFAQTNRIAVRLRHLAAIESRYFRCGREQCFRLDEDAIQGFIADGLQIVAAALAWLSLVSRKNSPIAPLTISTASADSRNAVNPPMLDVDPTKTQAPQQTATMSNTEQKL